MSAPDPTTVWTERFAARHAAAVAREATLRAESFVELPRLLGGFPVRLMTARDLHLLDGAGNALVCGTPPTPGDVAAFLWQLHAGRPAGDGLRAAWHRGLFLGRLRRRSLAYLPLLEQIRDYLALIFLDAPHGDEADKPTRPFGACFLVPALGHVAAEFGPVDPLHGRPWGAVPLPQLFAWQKLAARRVQGKDFVDRSPSDRVLSDFAAALNAAPAA